MDWESYKQMERCTLYTSLLANRVADYQRALGKFPDEVAMSILMDDTLGVVTLHERVSNTRTQTPPQPPAPPPTPLPAPPPLPVPSKRRKGRGAR